MNPSRVMVPVRQLKVDWSVIQASPLTCSPIPLLNTQSRGYDLSFSSLRLVPQMGRAGSNEEPFIMNPAPLITIWVPPVAGPVVGVTDKM